jgi:hypothetical protein
MEIVFVAFPSNGGVLAPARGWFLPIKYIHFFLQNIVSEHCFFPPAAVAVKEKHNVLCLILFAPSRRGGCKIRTFSITNFHLNFNTILFRSTVFFHPPRRAGERKNQTRKKQSTLPDFIYPNPPRREPKSGRSE